MTTELWDDPEWLKAEVQKLRGLNAHHVDVNHALATELERLRGVLRLQTEANLWRNKQLDDIGEILGEAYDDVPEPEAVTQVVEVLQRERPAVIGPPEAFRASFSWRDRARPDGFYDALSGDGFGFCEYVENDVRRGLMMQFDCAGIIACATLGFEALRETMAKEGYSIWPMVCEETEGFTDPFIRDLQKRITELERDVKSTTAENERLMARVYGDGAERDHAQIALDRVEEIIEQQDEFEDKLEHQREHIERLEAEADDPRRKLQVGDTFPFVPTVGLVQNPNAPEHEPEPMALTVHLPLPGYPGHAGAVTEMLAAFEVWGIKLDKPVKLNAGDSLEIVFDESPDGERAIRGLKVTPAEREPKT